MMNRFWGLAMVLFLGTPGVIVAQNTPTKVSHPTPHPEIVRLLQLLEGTWSIKDELAPNKDSPKGTTGIGTIIWRSGPGGFSVIEEFRSMQGGEDVTGLGEWWWDDAVNGYHTIWCDSTNPGGCIDFKNSVRWEDSKLVLQEDYEVKGKKFTFREEFSDFTSNKFTQTLFGGPVGGPLKVDEIIHATRIKSAGN
jgi:hypothetical protein